MDTCPLTPDMTMSEDMSLAWCVVCGLASPASVQCPPPGRRTSHLTRDNSWRLVSGQSQSNTP